MDISKLPGMTKRSFSIFKKKKTRKGMVKTTKPGAMDDNAKARMEEKKRRLKEAAGN